MSVLTATAWPSNAELIAAVARFGYFDGTVLDTTHGYGVFWKAYRPDRMVTCDLDPNKAGGVVADFGALPFGDASFDTVVLDPPYKLNGTPSDCDERYGVHIPARWQDRMALIFAGVEECCRVARRYVLVKCMDQVVSGKKRWQTMEIVNHAATLGFALRDRFDLLVRPRPQPSGRRQAHAQGNYSTLLVLEATR